MGSRVALEEALVEVFLAGLEGAFQVEDFLLVGLEGVGALQALAPKI